MKIRLFGLLASLTAAALLALPALSGGELGGIQPGHALAAPLSTGLSRPTNGSPFVIAIPPGNDQEVGATSFIDAPSSLQLGPTPALTTPVYLPLIIHSPSSDEALQMTALTNYYRAQAGCPPVTLNQQLTSAAQRHSGDMALNDFFDHQGSDGSWPGDRIWQAGYPEPFSAGENIAGGYLDVGSVMAKWMESQAHRRNIVDCSFEEIGVGHYYLANDTGGMNYHHYWTQVMAKPQ